MNVRGYRCVAVRPEPPLRPWTRSACLAVEEKAPLNTHSSLLSQRTVRLIGRSFIHEDINGSAQCEAKVNLLQLEKHVVLAATKLAISAASSAPTLSNILCDVGVDLRA